MHTPEKPSQGLNQDSQAGAAVFVKTPGLSPLKTRLAASLGQVAAETFYRLSCEAIKGILSKVEGLQLYWALAEENIFAQNFPLWAGVPQLHQGEGGLGKRLDQVYRELLRRHKHALLLGADTPHISFELIDSALALSEEGHIVIGPAVDGGFYLLASQVPIPAEVWMSVTYSSETTRSELCERLSTHTQAKQVFLPPLQDVDCESDLISVIAYLRGKEDLSESQRSILTWFEGLGA